MATERNFMAPEVNIASLSAPLRSLGACTGKDCCLEVSVTPLIPLIVDLGRNYPSLFLEGPY